ncbi:MAG: GNAT family N-acetyltransferase [Candidatus Thorarchaeota archaeon]
MTTRFEYMKFRIAAPDDFEQCRRYEFSHVSDKLLKQCIENGWVYISEMDDVVIGYARLEFIWLKIPFLALITLDDEHRGKGIGTALIERITQDLRNQGHEVIYTSSEVMEHRKNGFRECGIITGMNEDDVGEIFFVKNL